MDYPVFIKQLRSALYKAGDYDIVSITNTIIITDEVSTMATNGNNIFINPDWVDSLTMDETIGVLWHELLHDVFNHHEALWAQYDPSVGIPQGSWHNLTNISMDIIINDYVRSQGKTIPKQGIFRETLNIPKELNTSQKIFNKLLSDLLSTTKDPELQKALDETSRQEQDSKKVSNKQQQTPNSETGEAQKSLTEELEDISEKAKELEKEREEITKQIEELEKEAEEEPENAEENNPEDQRENNSENQQDPEDTEQSADSEDDSYNEPNSDNQKELDEAKAIAEQKAKELEKEREEITKQIEELEKEAEEKRNSANKGNSGGVAAVKVTLQQAVPSSIIQKIEQTKLFDDEPTTYSAPEIPYLDQIFSIAGSYLSKGGKSRSYHRPNRRGDDNGHLTPMTPIMPGTISRAGRANINFYIDVSGSMYDRGLDEPNCILHGLNQHIPQLQATRSMIYPFNTEVLPPIDPTMLIPCIGGGTYIDGVLKHINISDSDISVILTDAEDTITLSELDYDRKIIFVINSDVPIDDASSPNIDIIRVKRF